MVHDGIWEEILERLSAFDPQVAKEVVARAQGEGGPASRRAKEAFRELTGRWPSPLDEPLLQTARVLVEERLADGYKEAFLALGIGQAEGHRSPGQGEANVEPQGEEDPVPEAAAEVPTTSQEGAEAARESHRSQEVRWQQAYRLVFGEDPTRDPIRYRDRLDQAVLLYDPAKGRRWAFEQVKEAEERLQASRKRAEEILHLTDLVPKEGASETPGSELVYIHIGRLTAQVEELARRLDSLEGRLQKEATRYGGLKSALLNLRSELTTLKGELASLAQIRQELATLREATPAVGENGMRALKGEVLMEVEERLRLATDLWRSETEPRLRALEEWAKRITEAFRRTLEAKDRNKGLFGLLGGKTWKE